MGAATRESTEQAIAALERVRRPALALGDQLLSAARAISEYRHLANVLSDVGVPADDRVTLVDRIFGKQVGADAVALLRTMASARWSTPDDLVDAIEQVGLRAIARADTGSVVETELFTVHRAVSSEPRVELALTDPASPLQARFALLDRLLINASPETRTIVRHVVQLPRSRRIVEALEYAERIVADAKGRLVAAAQVAKPLSKGQLQRLEHRLTERYGRTVAVNQVIDPRVIGGVRIVIGDDVIDGTVRARLDDLGLRLAV